MQHKTRSGLSQSPGVFVITVIVCLATAARGEGIAWHKDFASALEAAKSRNVPLVVEFFTKTCPHCKRMEQTVHTDPAVVKVSAGQVWVRLDQQNDAEGRRLVREFNGGATPTYLAVAHDGKTVYWRFSGAVRAAGFAHNIGLIDVSADRLRAAKAALMRGDVEQGRILLREVVEKGATDASDLTDDALVLLGCVENAAWTDEGARAARDLWTRAISEHPKSDRAADAAFYLAALLPDLGEHDRAARLKALIESYPTVDASAAKTVLGGTAPAVAATSQPQVPQMQAVAEAHAETTVVAPAPVPEPEVKPQPKVQEKRVAKKPGPEAAPADKPPMTVAQMRAQQAKGIAGVGLTAEQVNRAIDRGADFLWKHIKEKDLTSERKLGSQREHIIASLALVHAGAHKRHPDFDAALRAFLARPDPGMLGSYETYQAGLLCMLVESYGDPTFEPTLLMAGRYLLEGQGADATWGYNPEVPRELWVPKPEAGEALTVSGGKPLDGAGAEPPKWTRTAPWDRHLGGDNSNTQYAILGLNSVARTGIVIAPDVWRKNLAKTRGEQVKENGGFGYHGNWSPYGSMTCAGICALAIDRHWLGEPDPAADPAIDRALAWLDEHFSVTEHPKHPSDWFYYYLYSLERVGRILDTEFIGPHEWYPLGARYLVDAQREDGAWTGPGSESEPPVPTSFALLFLTRATPTLKVEPKRGGSGTLKTACVPQSGRVYIILDASGSMLEEMDGREKFEIARGAVASLIKRMPESTHVALRAYGSRKRAIEKDADADTQLEIPLGPLNREAFLSKLGSLRARGKTPLARSMIEAAKDLASAAKDDEPVTVLLLTDGGEDTFPRQDPVKAAAELKGIKGVSLHIVGFDISREDWSEQLHAIARASSGRYWPAAQAAVLEQGLRAAVIGEPDGFAVIDSKGNEVARGRFGEEKTLPEGKYGFVTKMADQVFKSEFWVNTEAATAIVFNARRMNEAAPVAAPEPTSPAPAGDKFCTGCGQAFGRGAKFCTSCGSKVN